MKFIRTTAITALAAAALACGPKVVTEREPLPAECPSAADRENVVWLQVDDAEERAELLRWCAAVGPPFVGHPARPTPPAPLDSLAVVSWNTHVGGGAIGYLVRQLRTGVLTRGKPVPHFIVLLQEVYRSGSEVPRELSADAAYSDEIFPSRDLGVRRDVREVAEDLGLYVYYVPSMRNGKETDPPEDRGNAILSTLPLSDLVAWELPLWIERRVTIGASVEGVTISGAAWKLSIINVHLDLRTKFRSFFRSFGHVREKQMAFIMENLEHDGAALMGGDFNTWLGEKEEPAIDMARDEFSQPSEIPSHGTLKFGAILERQADFLLFRLPPAWSAHYRRIDDTYGSDHYPLLGFVRFDSEAPAESQPGANTDTED